MLRYKGSPTRALSVVSDRLTAGWVRPRSNRLDNRTFNVRSKFLVGAGGGNFLVAEHAGLPFGGRMGVGAP